MFVKKILMIMTALFLFCGCAAKPAKTSAASVEQTETEEKQNSSVSENADKKHAEQVSKDKKKALNTPSEKESAKAEKEKAVSKTEKKSKSKKNTASSEKKVSSSPVISEDASDSHIHDWVHHEAIGHYENKTVTDKEAWTETIVDQADWDEPVDLFICKKCGFSTHNSSEMTAHIAQAMEDGTECAGASEETKVDYVHHPAVTHDVNHPAEIYQENVWIQDTAAYDVCSICGAKNNGGQNK